MKRRKSDVEKVISADALLTLRNGENGEGPSPTDTQSGIAKNCENVRFDNMPPILRSTVTRQNARTTKILSAGKHAPGRGRRLIQIRTV